MGNYNSAMMRMVQSTRRYTWGSLNLILRWGKLPSVTDSKQRPKTLEVIN